MTDFYILWSVRLGVILLLLGIFLPTKSRKTILSKAIKSRTDILAVINSDNKIIKYLDRITEHTVFRKFMLKENSDDYVKIESQIIRAGGLDGMTPNIVQLFRIVLPPIFFVILLAIYLLKRSTQTTTLSSSILQKAVDQGNNISNGIIQAKVVAEQAPTGISWILIMWILVASLLLYMLPTYLIDLKIKARQKEMAKELPVIETFIVIMLDSGHNTVYDILTTLVDTTVFFKPYITMCLNEYYVDPKKAIQNMADRVNNEEFQVVCNSLKQAVDMDKTYTATFMKQHLDQISRLQELKREAAIKKKPLTYVFLLALPLTSVVVIWFYPWFTKALKTLTLGF